jgi:hypothetical protein
MLFQHVFPAISSGNVSGAHRRRSDMENTKYARRSLCRTWSTMKASLPQISQRMMRMSRCIDRNAPQLEIIYFVACNRNMKSIEIARNNEPQMVLQRESGNRHTRRMRNVGKMVMSVMCLMRTGETSNDMRAGRYRENVD